MSKVRRRSDDGFDDADLFADQDFDTDKFIDVMEHKGGRARALERSGWRKVEDLREMRLLRDQLQDWDDWRDDEL